MDIKIQIIVAAGVLLGLAAIINMIRKKSLELQYALAWLFVGGGILVLDCFPQILTWLAHEAGVASPVNMLFFLGFCFSLVIIFTLMVTVSRMSTQIKELTQAQALQKESRERKEDAGMKNNVKNKAKNDADVKNSVQ